VRRLRTSVRHPKPEELGAWFDNELEVLSGTWTPERIASHLPDCQRCQLRVHELRGVRAAMRGETPPPAPAAAPTRQQVRGWRYPSLAPLVAGVALIIGGLVAAGPGRTVIHHAGDAFFGTDQPPASNQTPIPPTKRPPEKRVSEATTTTSPPPSTVLPGITNPTTGPVTAAPSSTTVPLPPYRLGVVVPISGPFKQESADIVHAVQQVAISANTSGGILGRRVEVVAVAAEDTAGVAALSSRAEVMVGGLGTATTSLPWLLPADPGIFGQNVVAAEVTPRDAGVRLGHDLSDRGIKENVGVVKGSGSDAELADGLGEVVKTVSVAATKDDSNCENEIADLRKANATVLAVAGPPKLAGQCVQAADKAGWKPSGGIVLAPDAAFWHIDIMNSAQGARTVLGLPWPLSDGPGVKRFRAAVSNSVSYRALESFAAAELAVKVARETGGHAISVADVARGTWKNDLLDFQGTTNRGAGVVVLGKHGWAKP
jgi:ABC-type branched-subunit amino acid transport system substrate-binding protein